MVVSISLRICDTYLIIIMAKSSMQAKQKKIKKTGRKEKGDTS